MDQDELHRRLNANELHKQLQAWMDQEAAADRMPQELYVAGQRMLCSLWAAANNDRPPPTFKDDAEAFDKARRERS